MEFFLDTHHPPDYTTGSWHVLAPLLTFYLSLMYSSPRTSRTQKPRWILMPGWLTALHVPATVPHDVHRMDCWAVKIGKTGAPAHAAWSRTPPSLPDAPLYRSLVPIHDLHALCTHGLSQRTYAGSVAVHSRWRSAATAFHAACSC